MSGQTPPSFVARLSRFTALNVAQHVVLMALALVATPVIYHRLGETAYGILAVVTLLASQLSILEFGFGHATIRWVAQCRGRDDGLGVGRAVATSSWVFLATAGVGAGVMLFAAEPLVDHFFNVPRDARATAVAAVQVGSLFFAASVLGNLASAVWQGLQRFGTMNLISGVAALLQVLGSIALVLRGYGVLAVILWSTVLGLVSLAVNLKGLATPLRGTRWLGPLHPGTLREMGRFGFLLMLAGAFNQVVVSGGPLVLGHYVAIGALPFFTVPMSLFQRLNRLGYGLAGALFPLVAELEGRGDARTLERLFVSGTHTLLLVGVVAMAPAVLLAGPFLTVWMGPEFSAEAGRALELLFAAFAVALTAIPSIETARGTGRSGLLAGYTGIQAAVVLGGVTLLAPRWGASGAGAAFLAGHAAGLAFLGLVVGGGAVRRVFPPATLAVVGAGVGATLALLAVTTSPWLRLGAAVGLGAVLAGAALLWASTADEREVLRRLLRRP